MRVECIVWDFGDTIADERWMQVAPDSWPDWTGAYRSIVGDPAFAAAWNTGAATVWDLVSRIGARSPLTEHELLHHIEAVCSRITFFPSVMTAISSARGRIPQICATVNPDVFTRWVVPAYGLDQLFDVIVTSWQQATASKVDLAEHGLDQLSPPIALTATLLIDNRSDNVEEYRSRGGRAYLFSDEATFVEDLHHGALPGCLLGSGPDRQTDASSASTVRRTPT